MLIETHQAGIRAHELSLSDSSVDAFPFLLKETVAELADSSLNYRCGGSTRLDSKSRTGFPFSL